MLSPSQFDFRIFLPDHVFPFPASSTLVVFVCCSSDPVWALASILFSSELLLFRRLLLQSVSSMIPVLVVPFQRLIRQFDFLMVLNYRHSR